ncbi:NAD(P)/FAD-dependent oxidoreductase [Rhodovibrio sodomensis]|nr:FAD-dependent oxidoreductase [Rhodovibrio sodomensis]
MTTSELSRTEQDRTVVVLGGGFAGVAACRRLERRLPEGWQVTLVNADNAQVFTPLLPEAVGASMLPGHAVVPLRQLLPKTRIVTGRVRALDAERRTLTLEHGQTVAGAHLVLACGLAAHRALLPGMAEHSYALKTVGDALAIRNAVIGQLEAIERDGGPLQDDPRARFAVIGGGFSGIELAGQINDLVRAARRYYANVPRDALRVHVIHDGPRILPEVPENLAAVAARRMAKSGIAIRTEAQAAEINADAIALDDGTSIAAMTKVATIGTSAQPLMRTANLPMEGKRVTTHADLSVPDRPGLWALGDCAAVPNDGDGEPLPPTAQAANQAGGQLADNILRDIVGAPTQPVAYRSKGFMATIGDQNAVAQVGRLRLAGRSAWLLWRLVYLAQIPTGWRKLRIGFEWIWSCLFPVDIAHLRFRTSDDG